MKINNHLELTTASGEKSTGSNKTLLLRGELFSGQILRVRGRVKAKRTLLHCGVHVCECIINAYKNTVDTQRKYVRRVRLAMMGRERPDSTAANAAAMVDVYSIGFPDVR